MIARNVLLYYYLVNFFAIYHISFDMRYDSVTKRLIMYLISQFHEGFFSFFVYNVYKHKISLFHDNSWVFELEKYFIYY